MFVGIKVNELIVPASQEGQIFQSSIICNILNTPIKTYKKFSIFNLLAIKRKDNIIVPNIYVCIHFPKNITDNNIIHITI